LAQRAALAAQETLRHGNQETTGFFGAIKVDFTITVTKFWKFKWYSGMVLPIICLIYVRSLWFVFDFLEFVILHLLNSLYRNSSVSVMLAVRDVFTSKSERVGGQH
jgi:hypothetical protein